MPQLVLGDDDVQQLQSIASARSLPHSIVQRAQIVLACGAGETNTSIANRIGLRGMSVGQWRKRYLELGLQDLHDELRPGRPRTHEDDKMAEVIHRALQSKPAVGSTQWTARSLAAATGIAKSTAHGALTRKRRSRPWIGPSCCCPWVWATSRVSLMTPDSILAKLHHLCSQISGT
jgi:putative transposase